MNAQEAKVITAASKYGFEHMMSLVKSMAQSAYNYASVEPHRIDDIEDMKKRFEELGYAVIANDNQFKVMW